MVRPADLLSPRGDNRQAIEGGTNVNVGNVRLRSELSVDESRLTFALTCDDNAAASNYPHVQQTLQPDETRSLVFLEGYQASIDGGATPAQALTANQGPVNPNAGVNAVTTLTALSATGSVKIKPYIDGNLQSTIFDDGSGWQFAQIAELAELKEFANLIGKTLDGSVSIEWQVENTSTSPVEVSMLVRLLGKEV